jgi:hypothetical protein
MSLPLGPVIKVEHPRGMDKFKSLIKGIPLGVITSTSKKKEIQINVHVRKIKIKSQVLLSEANFVSQRI